MKIMWNIIHCMPFFVHAKPICFQLLAMMACFTLPKTWNIFILFIHFACLAECFYTVVEETYFQLCFQTLKVTFHCLVNNLNLKINSFLINLQNFIGLCLGYVLSEGNNLRTFKT